MKKMISIFSYLLLLISCQDDDQSNNELKCDVSNPIAELSWLKEQINESGKYSYYMTAKYNGQTVFYNGNCDPRVNYQSSVFNCSGELLGGTTTLSDSLSEIKILWIHQESKCQLSNSETLFLSPK